MPLMPGSPRTEVAAVGDDGVYRSIFQQPLLEIPATAPSYSWFEFLLHPDALQRHLETLRHQQAHGTHGATSAMELVREFLDQAQLVVDEGNGRNNRYRALLRVAAQVAVQMEIPLAAMEQQLPPHFQRLLLDGIVDFAESSSEDASTTTASTSTTTSPTPTMSPAQAQLLHQRWTLRMLVRESQNGYLTSTTKSEAEEQMSGFQIALSELAQHHLQIAQSLQQTLADDPHEELTPQTQFDAFYDLAVYFFSFNVYEKAYECFSRAFELLEDHGDALLTQLPATQRGSLEGYLAACEAVLETRSGPSGGGPAAATLSLPDEYASGQDPTATHMAPLTNPQTEAFLRAGVQLQRDHFLVANDLQRVFQVVFAHSGERAHDTSAAADTTVTVVATLSQHILQLSDASGLPDDPRAVRNLTVFLMLHGCWDALEHWRGLVALDETRRPRIEFAANCGLLLDYAHHSSSDAAATGAPAPSSASSATSKVDFSATRCNRFLSDVLASRRELLTQHGISASDDNDNAVESELAALLIDLPLWMLDTLVSVCAGLLHRLSIRNLSDHRVGFDLTPYGDLALLVALAQENPKKQPDARSGASGEDNVAATTSGGAAESSSTAHLATAALAKASLPEIMALHARGVLCLVRRCPREPRWISARADLALCPITKLRQSSLSDPHTALRGYLSAATLATNYFADDVSVVGIIDQSSLVRLSQCLVTIGAHVAAAVLYQCFAPDEAKYGLRMLQSAPESHDPAFFQYFWQLPFLELLVHLHSNPRHFNPKYVTLLTHLIQSPELNASNPVPVQKEVEHRILRCYFRDLCKIYLG